MRIPVPKLLQCALLLILATAAPVLAAEPAMPEPFAATYKVSYRGFQVGLLHFNLSINDEAAYVYETRAEPGLLARLLVSSNALERTVMQIDAQGVRPLVWFTEDGTSGTRKDGKLVFDWETRQVSGTLDGEEIDLPIEPGLQDRLSMQISVMTALLRGESPGSISLVDDNRIKDYSYTRVGSAQISTAAGRFETVQYESTRSGSSRVKHIWHAPVLDCLPVRVEQFKKGKSDTVMELVAVSPASMHPKGASGTCGSSSP